MTTVAMKPSARRVLNRLRQGPATTAQLLQPEVGGCRFGARILELRELGFHIDAVRLGQSSSRYTLTHDPERALSEAKDSVRQEQASPGSVPSQEGVRLAAPAQEPAGSLFDADEFGQRDGYRDAA